MLDRGSFMDQKNHYATMDSEHCSILPDSSAMSNQHHTIPLRIFFSNEFAICSPCFVSLMAWPSWPHLWIQKPPRCLVFCWDPEVPYADVFQPVVIALERYLDYPPVGAVGALGNLDAQRSKNRYILEQFYRLNSYPTS